MPIRIRDDNKTTNLNWESHGSQPGRKNTVTKVLKVREKIILLANKQTAMTVRCRKTLYLKQEAF